jgi:hypothetical protein
MAILSFLPQKFLLSLYDLRTINNYLSRVHPSHVLRLLMISSSFRSINGQRQTSRYGRIENFYAQLIVKHRHRLKLRVTEAGIIFLCGCKRKSRMFAVWRTLLGRNKFMYIMCVWSIASIGRRWVYWIFLMYRFWFLLHVSLSPSCPMLLITVSR